jgi:hypothetical protein
VWVPTICPRIKTIIARQNWKRRKFLEERRKIYSMGVK